MKNSILELQMTVKKLTENTLTGIAITWPDGPKLFTMLLNKSLSDQVGADKFDQIDVVVQAYFSAVLNCRKNKLEEARLQLDAADQLFDQLIPDAKPFASLFKLSAWGNFYYKENEFTKAINLLVEGLSISADLERKGLDVLIHRRIEQIQNIVNIYSKMGCVEQSDLLLKNIIKFVYTGVIDGLFIKDWNHEYMRKVGVLHENTLNSLFSQIATQNLRQMKNPIYNDPYFYNSFYKDFLKMVNADNYNSVILYNWMYIKASYVKDGVVSFFNNLDEFLKDPNITKAYDVYKVNLLSQAITILESHQLDQDAVISDHIRGYANQHLQGSQQIRIVV